MGYNEEKVSKFRSLFLVVLSLQLALLLERLVLDCLGGIYVLIIFGSLTFVINTISIFGASKNNIKIISFFMLWSVIWVCFNVFTLCVYLQIGSLDHEDKWLSFQEKNKSWFEVNGFGCNKTIAMMENSNCTIKFEHIEACQAGIHAFAGICNLCVAIYFVKKLKEDYREDRYAFSRVDSSFNKSEPSNSNHKISSIAKLLENEKSDLL